MRNFSMAVVALLTMVVASSASAAEWGDLKMRFVFDGIAPAAPGVNITKDQAFCGKHNLVDEALTVNPKNGGIRDVVVYMYLARGKKAPAAHESYEKTAKDPVHLDNKNCRYEPHVAILRLTQPLVLGNKDPVGHNTKIDTLNPDNPPVNPIIPAGGQFRLEDHFQAAERIPLPVSCSIHPWMTARLVVLDHPYAAVSDDDGNLVIKNLPVGEWTFQVWQEKAGYVSDVKVDGKKTSWSKGRVDVKIAAGENDLGDVAITADAFK